MPYARSTDPTTSWEATTTVTRISETQKAILHLLTIEMTDSELVERYQLRSRVGLAPMASDSGIRSRRHELAELGLVVQVGEGKSAFGRRSLLWKVA